MNTNGRRDADVSEHRREILVVTVGVIYFRTMCMQVEMFNILQSKP